VKSYLRWKDCPETVERLLEKVGRNQKSSTKLHHSKEYVVFWEDWLTTRLQWKAL
jgi:hypothetical protein